MKQQDANNQSIMNENLPAQNGQELLAAMLNDLPVNEAQQAEVKGGPYPGAANIIRFNTSTPGTV